MTLLSEYSEDDRKQILTRAHLRKIYYQIHYLKTRIYRWTRDNYNPLQPANKQGMLLYARSTMKTAIKIQNLAQELIDMLEADDV